MRHDHVRPYGRWPDSFVPTARDLREFDARASRSIDPARGGAYAPTTPLVVGGAGGLLLPSAGSALRDVETRAGGRIELDSGYPRFATPRTRTVLWPLGAQRFSNFRPLVPAIASDGALGYLVRTYEVFVPIPKRYMHDGATLKEARFRFRTTKPHPMLPTKGPVFIIMYQRGDAGPVPDPPYLFGVLGGGEFPLPATAEAYENDGNPHEIVSTTITGTHVVDTDLYCYSLIVHDEEPADPSPGTMVHSLTMTFNASELRPA
ncbi:hypothetical protein LZC95_19980 [Pendulispora brunnea]|uniref:Uncharacterized protein n=1 Tax=Pendulispora brunnea TaxID=2905690 RepID=A0ABZ2KKM1_9BACT